MAFYDLFLWGVPILIFASFALSALMELPADANVRRLARSARIGGRIWRRTPTEHLARMTRWRRASVAILVAALLASTAAAIGSLVALAYVGDLGLARGPFLLLEACAIGGLAFVTWAHHRWAPQLHERVRLLLESEAATTNHTPPMGRADS